MVYLTPRGETPSEGGFLPAGYGLVADVVEAVAKSRRSALDPAVHVLMVHYAQMLRRHIVTDSSIADLCQSIYQSHKRALDLIFEHRSDRVAAVHAILLDRVRSHDDLILDASPRQVVRFGHRAWEGLPKGEGWTPSGRLVLFTLEGYTGDHLDLNLWVGPGPAKARQPLIDLATAHQPPYDVSRRNQRWKSIYSRRFLRPADYQDAALGDIEAQIRERWEEFAERTLPALVAPIQAEADTLATPVPVVTETSGSESGLTPEPAWNP